MWILVLPAVATVAWLAKGVTSMIAGHDASYWGDDFVYGGVALVLLGRLYWSIRRAHARQRTAAAAPLDPREG